MRTDKDSSDATANLHQQDVAVEKVDVQKVRLTSASKENPLIVVDGVVSESADLSLIDPETIYSVNILKDATATALYGEKGVHGVILITTKNKGK